ncbi:VWA domain-containing protein [Dactylosporangium sp. NPDC049742]|uniref:VWA domain-containing protein n=1 Tax=Dactylosporangium sp. NPDC049742 TaxID=3154737 RepID=UPI00342AFA45
MAGRTQLTAARAVQLVKEPSGAPAVNLAKVRESGHVDLAKRADKAGLALSRRGLGGIRAQAMLVLDHSGSMRPDYKSGAVQTLVERALGFALQIDIDGTVPVVPFDTKVLPTVAVTVDNYSGVVDREINQGWMGTTNLADALAVVLAEAEQTTAPIFCIVVADGSPDSKRATTKVVCELSRYPVFLKLLAIKPVEYFQSLDDLDDSKRLLDNVDTKYSTEALDLLTCSDLQFAEAMADEWDTWVAAATAAGILTP